MIQIRTYEPGVGFKVSADLGALPALLADDDTIVWANLEEPTDEELAGLAAMLHLHPLAVEDLQGNGDRPRLRRYRDQLSIVFLAVKRDSDSEFALRFVRLNILAGSRFVATVVREPLEEIAEAFTSWRGNVEHLSHDAGGPLYAILDTLIDDYFPVIDDIADRVDTVEDEVVENHARASLSLIFTMKKAMLQFRRVASGARDVVNVLLRHDDLFGAESSVFFQDLYDHTVRVTDSVDTYRDLLSNAMDTYLSATSNLMAESANRLNVVMQTLTAWSIILGSGTFIAGIYGMNVEGLPLAARGWGFLFASGLCLLVAGALFALFRRKRWI